MHTVREGRSGDMGGGHKPGNNWHKFGKTINDNKAGFKVHDDKSKKKVPLKKDAEQKPRKPFSGG